MQENESQTLVFKSLKKIVESVIKHFMAFINNHPVMSLSLPSPSKGLVSTSAITVRRGEKEWEESNGKGRGFFYDLKLAKRVLMLINDMVRWIGERVRERERFEQSPCRLLL